MVGFDSTGGVLRGEVSELRVQDGVVVEEGNAHVQSTKHTGGVGPEFWGVDVVTAHTLEHVASSRGMLEDTGNSEREGRVKSCEVLRCEQMKTLA